MFDCFEIKQGKQEIHLQTLHITASKSSKRTLKITETLRIKIGGYIAEVWRDSYLCCDQNN